WPLLLAVLGIIALVASALVGRAGRSGLAFTFTAAAALLWVATVFTSLYPTVMVSSTDFGNSLTVANSASAHYTLVVMTVVAPICVPVILVYQAWTYHVFRGRIAGEELPSPTA